jgi:5-methylcytosine-specific restriction endonuclease McrA
VKSSWLSRKTPMKRGPFRIEHRAESLGIPRVVDSARQDPAVAKNAPRKSQGLKPIPPKVREAVKTRADFRCELCRKHGEHLHVHHRRLRSQGGTNDPANLLYACYECHNEIHRTPELSYQMGWLVRSTDDPALIQVRRLA